MIRDDYKAYGMSVLRLIKGFLTGHTFFLVLSQRWGNWLYRHHVRFLPELVRRRQMRKHACELSPYATIGKGLRVHHSTGIVVGHEVIIGDYCELFQNVTIGSNRVEQHGRYMPVIGDHVTICAGAVIIGSIRIGSNVVIGANSVVTKDVPDNVVVAGSPARIIRENRTTEGAGQ